MHTFLLGEGNMYAANSLGKQPDKQPDLIYVRHNQADMIEEGRHLYSNPIFNIPLSF